ncbi:MAG: 2-oxoacid:acceptor oxidoreductase subunit alpha [Gammaproteobacteria bacterium]|nr:2-oxoacid:acceptor oxidoreductase subunit alpha [Gammaproteobacteria bacterium]
MTVDSSTETLSLSVAITGSGGSGAITCGLILLEAVAAAGLYGLMSRSLGPQIRGGESAAMLRIAREPIDCLDDRFDLLIGLDWLNLERFADELPLVPDSLIVTDTGKGRLPDCLLASRAEVLALPVKQLADEITGGRSNMVALGIAAFLCGLDLNSLLVVTRRQLADKGEKTSEASALCVARGFRAVQNRARLFRPYPAEDKPPLWNISGNEACGLGGLRGGIRFVAAYPITPASDMLEWLSPRLEEVGGSLLQAEDELASVNMLIGASFGGVPAMTATSGPGLSLMAEGLGLAVASETPLVVINVTRGGPSTGIPTKSEQSDLNLAVFGMHGDAPHLVLAPLSIRDCAFTTEWAVRLAEALQTVAIVLTDQFLGQNRGITDPAHSAKFELRRKTGLQNEDGYRRYAIAEDGLSSMGIPGMPECIYTADGLEHDEQGVPSNLTSDHPAQLAKRLHKLTCFDYGPHWLEIQGEGDVCLLTWGSTAAAVFEAARRLRTQRIDTRVIALRLLAPLQREALRDLLRPAMRILVVELNHQAQCFHYLHAQQVLPEDAGSLARPGPIPWRPGEIVNQVLESQDR